MVVGHAAGLPGQVVFTQVQLFRATAAVDSLELALTFDPGLLFLADHQMHALGAWTPAEPPRVDSARGRLTVRLSRNGSEAAGNRAEAFLRLGWHIKGPEGSVVPLNVQQAVLNGNRDVANLALSGAVWVQALPAPPVWLPPRKWEENSVTLAWMIDPGAALSAYEITVYHAAGAMIAQATLPGDHDAWRVTGLEGGTGYRALLRGQNDAGLGDFSELWLAPPLGPDAGRLPFLFGLSRDWDPNATGRNRAGWDVFAPPPADINRDGRVDRRDLERHLRNHGAR